MLREGEVLEMDTSHLLQRVPVGPCEHGLVHHIAIEGDGSGDDDAADLRAALEDVVDADGLGVLGLLHHAGTVRGGTEGEDSAPTVPELRHLLQADEVLNLVSSPPLFHDAVALGVGVLHQVVVAILEDLNHVGRGGGSARSPDIPRRLLLALADHQQGFGEDRSALVDPAHSRVVGDLGDHIMPVLITDGVGDRHQDGAGLGERVAGVAVGAGGRRSYLAVHGHVADGVLPRRLAEDSGLEEDFLHSLLGHGLQLPIVAEHVEGGEGLLADDDREDHHAAGLDGSVLLHPHRVDQELAHAVAAGAVDSLELGVHLVGAEEGHVLVGRRDDLGSPVVGLLLQPRVHGGLLDADARVDGQRLHGLPRQGENEIPSMVSSI